MRLLDIIKISQRNLFRAKLRTFLTVAAVFIGALTLSLTNGVGNGIKAYVNKQLGNLGAKDAMIVQAKQTQSNPIANDVKRYDPDRKTSGPFFITMITKKDIEKIQSIEGVLKTLPQYTISLEYIGTGEDKYEAIPNQYVEGLNIDMASGETVDPNSLDEITVPIRYIRPSTEREAIGKYVVIAYKDSAGKTIEKPLRIVGVQQQSLVGTSAINISDKLTEEIYLAQTKNIPSLSDTYIGAIVKFNPDYSKDEIEALKKRFEDAGYTARTLEDQIGVIGTVINGILVVLNVFGAITLLAAAFGIINTLLMSVNERTSEIGLMKALGANRKTIFSIFAIEAASIGFWGAALGVATSIGLGTIASNYAADNFLKDFVGFQLLTFPLLPSLAVLFGIILLAFIVGALPSLKASKLDPIKALRYE